MELKDNGVILFETKMMVMKKPIIYIENIWELKHGVAYDIYGLCNC
jgi:hypothetical protein